MTVSRVAAIIPAAGQSTRVGFDKLFANLDGSPVLAHTINAFERWSAIDIIVLVTSAGSHDRVKALVARSDWPKVRDICLGGRRRQDSVAAGLALVEDADVVAIHDGARPLVSSQLIERGVRAAREWGAAVPLVPVVDTIKVVKGPANDPEGDGVETIVDTPDRSRLRTVQTPQVFQRQIIARAHRAITEEVTDDASMVERLGLPVVGFPGERRNIKITTADDLAVARALLGISG